MESVEHLVEGRESWKIGVGGFMTRFRGILATLILGLLSGGIFAWGDAAKKWCEPTFTLPTLPVLIACTIFIFAAILVTILVIRAKSIRSLELKWQLHEIAHFFRDRVCWAHRFGMDQKKSKGSNHAQDSFRSFCDESCNRIRDYFRTLTGDKHIEAGIRIADKLTHDPSSQEVFYCTAGRSNGLNSARDLTSCPIPANKGVPRFFLDLKDCRGVLIYHDLERAIKQGAFMQTQNETDYAHEIRTMMVAPINGWTGKRNDMIGLLYITSRRDVFRAKHVDPLKAIADMLGTTMPRIADCRLYSVLSALIRVTFVR